MLRWLFFLLFVHPLVLLVLGLNVQHRKRLPQAGPAVLMANHNSHLDALVLMSLLPVRLLPKVRPVAAEDYFCCTRLRTWFALTIMDIIAIKRDPTDIHGDPLGTCSEALGRGEILILFPEGSRGEPERLAPFKCGVAHLAKRHPNVPFAPVFLHGLGKALPKGEALLVPFFCDVFVGEALYWTGDKRSFMDTLECHMKAFAEEGHFPPWE